jgi:endo-1,4-beta-mannosidase
MPTLHDSNPRRMRFGVNYTPTGSWWYAWNDWHSAPIARDLDAIAALGADHVRIMLLWTFFQPNAGWVSPAHLDRLDDLMRLAAERGLDVVVTVFNGHLTGQNFRQGWEHGEDFFTSPRLRRAQELFLDTLAARLRTHRNLLGFDLGNELNCCWWGPTSAGDAWMADLLTRCRALLPDAVHVNGVDHQPWFGGGTFSPAALVTHQPIAALHSWIEFTGARKRGHHLAPCCLGLAAAMTALAKAHAGSGDHPVWIQEYGASTEWMPAEDIPRFLEGSTLAAIHAGATWFTWWASHDIDRHFTVNPLEYSLGLLDCDNREKPAAETFRRLAKEWRGAAQIAQPNPSVAASVDSHATTWAWLEAWLAQPR